MIVTVEKITMKEKFENVSKVYLENEYLVIVDKYGNDIEEIPECLIVRVEMNMY